MRGLLDVPLPVTGVRSSLWRAVALFRVAALAVCLFLIVQWQSIYARPGVALTAGAAMIVVTAVVCWLALRGRAHRAAFVLADLAVTLAITLLSMPAQTAAQQHGGMVTLTTIWAAGPTIEAAFVGGPLGGLLVGAVQYATSALVAGTWQGRTLYSGVLLLLTGVVVGYVTQLAVRAEADLRAATAAQAALTERERLARSIHDGVLQVLGLVHRTGADAGGRWAELGRAAAEQEAALRALITSHPATGDDHRADLSAALRALRSQQVTVAAPAEPVLVRSQIAAEVTAAVRATLHNVATHAGDGARAWVLLEALEDELRVTVRDDGCGIPNGRLAAAEAAGRLGVARSVRGRIADLGGRCTITSAPGVGTEIDMVLPFVRARR